MWSAWRALEKAMASGIGKCRKRAAGVMGSRGYEEARKCCQACGPCKMFAAFLYLYFKIPCFINHLIDLLPSEGMSYVQEQQRDKMMKVLRRLMGQGGQVERLLPKVLTRFMLWHIHQAFM